VCHSADGQNTGDHVWTKRIKTKGRKNDPYHRGGTAAEVIKGKKTSAEVQKGPKKGGTRKLGGGSKNQKLRGNGKKKHGL